MNLVSTQNIRRITQGAFLLLFLFLFIQTESKGNDELGYPVRLFLDFDGDRFPRRMAAAASALLVGPEGGWTADERERAAHRGWKVVALPAGPLRAETAAIAALVLLRSASEAGAGKRKT